MVLALHLFFLFLNVNEKKKTTLISIKFDSVGAEKGSFVYVCVCVK